MAELGADVQSFFKYEAERGIRDVFQAQLDIAENKIYAKNFYRVRSGNLETALKEQKHTVTVNGSESLEARVQLPTYIRFLDMKRMGNYQIYNRQVYGILYKKVLSRIKYGYDDYVRKVMKGMLQDSAPQNRKV